MTATRTSWGQRLRDRREAAGLTQAELAEAVGVGQAAVSRWEAGSTAPSVRLLPAIEAALDGGA